MPIRLYRLLVPPRSRVDLFLLSEEIVDAKRHAIQYAIKVLPACGQCMASKDLLGE
jgi:hypothetical protein